jgi:hypothetical protein
MEKIIENDPMLRWVLAVVIAAIFSFSDIVMM